MYDNLLGRLRRRLLKNQKGCHPGGLSKWQEGPFSGVFIPKTGGIRKRIRIFIMENKLTTKRLS